MVFLRAPLFELGQIACNEPEYRSAWKAKVHNALTERLWRTLKYSLSAQLRQSERGATSDRQLSRHPQPSAAASVARPWDLGGNLVSNSSVFSKTDRRLSNQP